MRIFINKVAPWFLETHREFRFRGWVDRPLLALLCAVRFCTIIAFLSGSALGSFVAVLLIIKALMKPAVSIIVLALLY